MTLSDVLSVGGGLTLVAGFGLGLLRRLRRGRRPLLGTALLVMALATFAVIVAIRLQAGDSDFRRSFLGISWGAVIFASVIYATVLDE